MKKLLHLKDLEKSFCRQMVLDHVGFDLQPGEIIGLIGPSGAGKSTMIKTML
ncbi:MAG: ATP-binding cassette domain-containing protein, partial [Streptococcus mitis]|nr:ATP-binding cassette domain-containing protein [Streptococcus mitis]